MQRPVSRSTCRFPGGAGRGPVAVGRGTGSVSRLADPRFACRPGVSLVSPDAWVDFLGTGAALRPPT